MKTSNSFPFIALGAFAFSYLFTWHDPGFNYLVFWALGLGLLLLSGIDTGKRRRMVPFAGLSLLYAAPVFLYGSEPMSVLFWPIWIIGGVSIAYSWQILPLAGISGVFSHIASPFVLASDLIRDNLDNTGRRARALALYSVSGLVFLLFTFVYAGASTSVSATLERIFVFDVWDGFVYGFVGIVGLVVMTGLLRPYLPKPLQDAEASLPTRIVPGQESFLNHTFKLKVEEEYRPALVLVVALTALATFAALGDAFYLFRPDNLPDGVTYSDFVHKSVEVIVFGVILVALLAGLLFRDEQHNRGQFGKIRAVFYLFLGANLLLIAVAAAKNAAYIEAYSLSFKRIGVYVWLALVTGGLALTAAKLYGMRSFFWLVRNGIWLAAATLGFYHVLPTDRMVRLAQMERPAKMDLKYLLEELSSEEKYFLATEATDDMLAKPTGDSHLDSMSVASRRETILADNHPNRSLAWQSQYLAHRLALAAQREREGK